MTLDEAIQLAEQGDVDTMMSLGRYYFEEEGEYSEARKWYTAAAEAGNPVGMSLAALTIAMIARATRMIGGSSAAMECIKDNEEALKWLRMASANDRDDAESELDIIAELGASYYLASVDGENDSSVMLQNARATLEPHMSQLSYEGKMYLAFTLYDMHCKGKSVIEPSADGDAALMVSLLEECSQQTEESVPYLAVVCSYLGSAYLLGTGCRQDFDKAHEALVKADQLGFDCSELLAGFRKKLFGGWDYKF